ncbi:hypothetical protein [Rhodococcus spongiicola]|nr:hypothetical protein [Rhodococcus spongiicola]
MSDTSKQGPGDEGLTGSSSHEAGYEPRGVGSYRYHDSGEIVAGEIWSQGPFHRTLWVLGPEGPVVVDVHGHQRIPYDLPTYFPETHLWGRSSGYGYRPIDLRGRRPSVTAERWAALTEGAFEVRDDSAGTRRVTEPKK